MSEYRIEAISSYVSALGSQHRERIGEERRRERIEVGVDRTGHADARYSVLAWAAFALALSMPRRCVSCRQTTSSTTCVHWSNRLESGWIVPARAYLVAAG